MTSLHRYTLLGCLFASFTTATAVAQEWNVPAPQAYEKTQVCLGTLSTPLTVELADTTAQHARGLMQRTELAPDAGMLFRYPQLRSGRSGFWMYQTLIPLDIAYLNQRGEVVKTFTMLPCGSDNPSHCRSYAPGKPYQFALEMNAGFFADNDIRLGDKLTIVGELAEGESCDDVSL